MSMSALDVQVGGNHYRQGGIQPVQYIEANDLKYLEGAVVKRVTRHDKEGGKGRQDIEKAIHELELLLELRYPPQPDPTNDVAPAQNVAPTILEVLKEMSDKESERLAGLPQFPVMQAPNDCKACGRLGGHGGLQCPSTVPSCKVPDYVYSQ